MVTVEARPMVARVSLLAPVSWLLAPGSPMLARVSLLAEEATGGFSKESPTEKLWRAVACKYMVRYTFFCFVFVTKIHPST